MAHNADEQLRLARLVQDALLPPPLINLPGLEIAVRSHQSADIGGDFIDCFSLGPRHLAFYLGDVQGKGLEAALYALLISGLLRGLHKADTPAAEVLLSLNRKLCFRSIPGKFCCLAYGIFDLERGELHYASAGLPFPMLLRGGKITRIELTGTPAGLFDPCVFDESRVALQSGDRFLFFSDGLPDAFLKPGGGLDEAEAQMEAVFASIARDSTPPEQLAGSLLEAVGDPERSVRDDVTFLMARIR